MNPLDVIKQDPLYYISKYIVILSALHLLMVGIKKTDYISLYAGAYAQYIYIIVGLAGLMMAYREGMWFYNAYKSSPTEVEVKVV